LLFSWLRHSLFRLNHEDKGGILFQNINIHLQEYMISPNSGDSPLRKPEKEIKRNRGGGQNDMPGRDLVHHFRELILSTVH
jgi:hypothetical protein